MEPHQVKSSRVLAQNELAKTEDALRDRSREFVTGTIGCGGIIVVLTIAALIVIPEPDTRILALIVGGVLILVVILSSVGGINKLKKQQARQRKALRELEREEALLPMRQEAPPQEAPAAAPLPPTNWALVMLGAPEDRELAQAKLADELAATPEKAASLLQETPCVIKRDLSKDAAELMVRRLRAHGFEIVVQEQ